jgi:Asp-tRNA(Asn)/Glu-tRNA(Gln) amidotransferase B subunit
MSYGDDILAFRGHLEKMADSELQQCDMKEVTAAIAARVSNDMYRVSLTDDIAMSIVSSEIMKRGLLQARLPVDLRLICDAVVAENQGRATVVADDPSAIMWLVGQVMRKCGGSVSPHAAREMLQDIVSKQNAQAKALPLVDVSQAQ